jgi:hypothetical protein
MTMQLDLGYGYEGPSVGERFRNPSRTIACKENEQAL